MTTIYKNKTTEDLIHNWCDVLERKAKQQTYGNQIIYFWFSIGKRYYKIIRADQDTKNNSVHAFVDKISGDIFKPASWNSPYKDARYNIINDYDKLLTDCDWSGRYLYKYGN